jgi:phosphomannomutase
LSKYRIAVTIFRAYDVRGVYGDELTEESVRRVGQAFGSYIDGGRISLGRDTRVSGPSLQKSFLEGVLSTGCSVDSYGIIPISILSYVTWANVRNAAAYISASHNPPEYNGVRFRTEDGYGLLYRETDIMRFYTEGNFLSGSGQVADYNPAAAVERYAEYVGEKLELRHQLRVVLDTGNGSACIIGPLYEKLGFDPVMINGKMDGSFPGRGPSPTEETLQGACKAVVEQGADYGVGFDPDADRGIVIDDKGRVLPPEKVAIILALRRNSPGDLVISGFDCSMILERELIPEGIRVQRERVGDVYVANTVKNSGAVLGVERSGHFFMPEFQYSDDPFAMSLALGEIISEGQKLSELADLIPDYPYRQLSIRMDEVDPVAVMKVLGEKLASMNPDNTDGLKITTDTYSILIRPSNTEPLIRLSVETEGGDLEELVEKYEKIIKQTAKNPAL